MIKSRTKTENIDVARVTLSFLACELRPNLGSHVERCALSEGVRQLGIARETLHYVEICNFGYLASVDIFYQNVRRFYVSVDRVPCNKIEKIPTFHGCI